MRKSFILLICLLLSSSLGCSRSEEAAITIGPIRVTAEEFDEAYQQARFQGDRELSRQEFLDLYVNRKLFLKEAEGLGLDKDPVFLQGLQLYWEQALMKSVIARKMNEATLSIRVSDNEINDYYQRHKDTDFAGRSFPEVKEQIKRLLFQLKQKLELQNWMANLRRKAGIKYDYGLLRIKPQKEEDAQ